MAEQLAALQDTQETGSTESSRTRLEKQVVNLKAKVRVLKKVENHCARDKRF